LNGTFHLSPHENILTIALINIHYLYNIWLIYSHILNRRALLIWQGMLEMKEKYCKLGCCVFNDFILIKVAQYSF
jgi:hypothetical protein